MNVAGKSIVVTGGAGYLGSAICESLSAAGASVLCLSSKIPISVSYKAVRCDVANETDFKNQISDFAIMRGGIDGLVNCASRSPRGIDLQMSADGFANAIRESLVQYFTTTRCTLVHMNQNASVVNVASLWGIECPNPAIYLDLKNEPSIAGVAAQAGIIQMTKYMAGLYAQKMRINALIPGWFPKMRGEPRPDYMHEIESRIPMGRIGKPEDLTGAVEFLLSDASRYMTGQNLIVDGGYSLHSQPARVRDDLEPYRPGL